MILHSGHTVCFWRFLTALEFRSGNLSWRKSLRFWVFVHPIPTDSVNRGSNKLPKIVLTICVDNIALWTHCLFLTLFDSCWAKSRVSFRKRCLLSSSCNITKKKKEKCAVTICFVAFCERLCLSLICNCCPVNKKICNKV